MPNEPEYVDGTKKLVQYSENWKSNPYYIKHSKLGNGCYFADVDSREWRNKDGIDRTVAYIELEQCKYITGKYGEFFSYLDSFMYKPQMTHKLDTLVYDASILGIPAFLVIYTEEMDEFIIVTLPWDKLTYHRATADEYWNWIRKL